MPVNELLLRKVKKGDPLSAREYNEIIRLLKRKVTGPNVVETATGWHIRPEPPPPAAPATRAYVDEYCYVKSNDADASFGWDNQAIARTVKAGETWVGIFKFAEMLEPFPIVGNSAVLIVGDVDSIIVYVDDASANWGFKIDLYRINEDFTPQTLTYNQYLALDTTLLAVEFYKTVWNIKTADAEDIGYVNYPAFITYKAFIESPNAVDAYGFALVPSVIVGANGSFIHATIDRALSLEAWFGWQNP